VSTRGALPSARTSRMTTPHSGHLGCSATSKRSMSAKWPRYAGECVVIDGYPQVAGNLRSLETHASRWLTIVRSVFAGDPVERVTARIPISLASPFRVDRYTVAGEGTLAHSSAWRVSDAVAFDMMRESSAQLITRLLEVARHRGADASDARRELLTVRADAGGVDGFDRKAVDALLVRFSDRIRTLEGAS
jgi:hypothetical protein